jgi:hypothetical protein
MRIPQDGMSNSPYGPHAKYAHSYSCSPHLKPSVLYFFFFFNFINLLYFRIFEVRVRFDPYTGKVVSPPPNPEGILLPFTCRTACFFIYTSSFSLISLLLISFTISSQRFMPFIHLYDLLQ